MAFKPTYEELIHRITELEARLGRYTEVEAELTKNLRFTESLLAAIPTPVFFKDEKGRYIGCNPAFSDLMGVSDRELKGKTVHELWPSEHAEVYHQKDLELIQNAERQVYEFEVNDKNGDVRPVIFYKNVFYDGQGQVAGLVGGFVDITERKKAEMEQQAIFNMSLDMLCIADIHTATFLEVNPAFTQTLGYSRDELLGRSFIEFIHPEDIEPTIVVIDKQLKAGEKVVNFKNRYRCKNGEFRWLNWVSHPMADKGLTYAVAHDITEEIRANEAIRSQRDLLNSLFDNILLGVTVWDAAGGLLMVNKEFTNLTGYTIEDIGSLADWFSKAYPDPEYRRHVLADWNDAKKASDAVREFKVACKSGEFKDVEFRGAFLPDGRALVTLADITERKSAREESIRRQQFLELVLYHAPDAIVTLDSEHRVIDWNPGAVKMFGYIAQEAIGHQLDDLVARDDHRDEAVVKTQQVLSGKNVEAFETIRYRKDGTPINVIAAGSPIMIDGVLTGVVAVYTDITKRVTAEAALKESEKNFRTLIEASPFGIALIGEDGSYRYINPRFQEMFGYTIGDVPNGTVWFEKAFPDPSERSQAIHTWMTDMKSATVGQYRTYVFAVTCKNGSCKQVQFRSVAMENRQNLVIYEDITERTKLERQFQQAQKFEAVGTLAGGIAHDFNNLLMGIQGRASLMAVDLDISHPHTEHLNDIQDLVGSAANLTRQLLGFARGGKYEVKPLDLNDLVRNSAAMFGRTKKEIRLHIKTHPQTAVVAADRRQIEQVLLNIFVNAWQAMPDGGDLYLETGIVDLEGELCAIHQVAPGRFAKMSITDSGIGMAEEVRSRIFDPFYTTKEKDRGTGLGLASAYGIIKNHGGLITVYSEVGRGSTFNVFLPISESDVVQGEAAEPRLMKGHGTILLIDDEDMVLSIGRAMLSKLGYDVILADGGRQGLESIRQLGATIDLVILDMIMPDLDGGKTFDLIREAEPQMKVLLSSGYAINGKASDILSRGCNGFIQKPFNLKELSEKLHSLLAS